MPLGIGLKYRIGYRTLVYMPTFSHVVLCYCFCLIPYAQVTRGLEEGDGFKYFGILDDLKHDHMKEEIYKEYLRRIRKSAINARAVSIIRYGAGIIKWTKEELRKMDRKRKSY